MEIHKLVDENSRRDWWLRALLREIELTTMMLLAMVELNLELEEMDIKTTFLYGHLDEIIYFKRIEWISDRKQ